MTRIFRIIIVLSALFALSCSGKPRLPEVTSNLLDINGVFILVVSNQSYAIDPVDILVEIDGELVVSDYFYVGTQHNFLEYQLSLADGIHHVSISSNIGDARLSTEFSAGINETAVVLYWYSPDKPDSGGKHFSFETYDKPMGFR